MTRATNDAQETGLLVALLAARTHHENPSHWNNLINPGTAQTALDTIRDGLRGAPSNSVIAAIEGAATYQITRRPAPEPYTGNPEQWLAWPGYYDGIRDFQIISGTLPNAHVEPNQDKKTDTEQAAQPATADNAACDDPGCVRSHARDDDDWDRWDDDDDEDEYVDSGPTTPQELHEQRKRIANMNTTYRTGYLTGVLAAMDRHFGPQPPF